MTSPVGLWFDWFSDGFGTHPALNDCTSLLMSYTKTVGGTPELTGAAQAGSATFVLQNPDGLFDPDNAAGALYGLLHDGIRVWFGANEDGSISGAGTVRGRFAGRVTDISPIPVAGAGDSTPTVEIVCEEALGWFGRTPVALSVTDAEYIPPLPVPWTCPTASAAAVPDHITDQTGSSAYSLSVTPSAHSIIAAGFMCGGTNMALSGVTTLDSVANTGHETAAHGWAVASSTATVTASYTGSGLQAAAMGAFPSSATAPLQSKTSGWVWIPSVTLDAPPTPGNMLVAIATVSQNATPATWAGPTGWTRVAEGQANGVHPFGGDCVGVYVKCSDGTDGSFGVGSSWHAMVTLMEWPY